jgi:hypothetical protein
MKKKSKSKTNRYNEIYWEPPKPKKKKTSRPSKSLAKGKAKPKAKPKAKRNPKMADQQKQIDDMKERAGRISGKIRNLENEINATRPTPPDPNLAAQFDAIQQELEALKNPETAGTTTHAEKDSEEDNGKKGGKKK